MASIIKGVSILLANQYNLQSHLQYIIVREEDASGNFRTTDNGTRYVLRKIKNPSGTVLPTIGIQVEFKKPVRISFGLNSPLLAAFLLP